MLMYVLLQCVSVGVLVVVINVAASDVFISQGKQKYNARPGKFHDDCNKRK